MWEYLKLHEAFVREAMSGKHGELSLIELKAFHDRQTACMQHERFIHLVVTLFVALFTLLSIGFAVFVPEWPMMAMALLLLGLSAAYLLHYFRLENGVQRFYGLANELDRRLGVVSARYERGKILPWNHKE